MNKTRLQELCQKRRWDLPQYTHQRVGTGGFLASVTVNGSVYESPDAESRSAKEAQNKAATVALETLSGTPAADVVTSPPPPAVAAAVEIMPTAEPLSPQPPHNECHATYKSQLQVYAQKRTKEPPEYTIQRVGLPHAPQFKATVKIDGLIFESPKFFRTTREAEHAAAEVALANLPTEKGSQQNIQDELAVPYKTLLQELMQKDKQLLPVYTTVKDFNSTLPLFSSTVEVCGMTFKGEVSKTKKQAEANAAKVALDNIKERKQSQSSSSMKSKSTVPPVSLSPPVRILTRDQVLPGKHISGPQDSKPPPPQPKFAPIQTTKDCSLAPAGQSNLGLTGNSIFSDGPVLAENKDHVKERVELSLLCNRIQVYPRNPGSAVPYGAIPLPFSTDKWVAASLDFPNHGGQEKVHCITRV